MRFLFHLLGIIYFLIWIVIGAALLVGIFTVAKLKPWTMLGNVGNFGSTLGVLNSTGNIGDVLQKIQSKKGDIPAAFNSLSKDQQTCLKNEFGESTVNQALAGTLNFTPDLLLKAMKCVK